MPRRWRWPRLGLGRALQHRFSGRVEEALEQIGGLIAGTVPQEQLCWYEVKLFERDNKVMEQLAGQELAGPLEEIVTACERELGRRQRIHHHQRAL